MKRQESTEDYLETIYLLKQKLGLVRSVDVANDRCFSKPSVSVAMKNLREKGFITVDAEGSITLTGPGHALAASIYERHIVLAEALVLLGVSEETAKEDACRLEHDISEETFAKIKAHLEKQREMLHKDTLLCFPQTDAKLHREIARGGSSSSPSCNPENAE